MCGAGMGDCRADRTMLRSSRMAESHTNEPTRSDDARLLPTVGAQPFSCRAGCGACCIAPSIARPFYGMPNGKKAGERCVHLDAQNRCGIFGKPERPQFCADLRAEPSMCGARDDEAMAILSQWEQLTEP